MGENLLAIDCGTQSVRALLFNPKGDLLVIAKVPIEPYTSPRPGWAEQDPEVFWNALCKACQQVFKNKKGDKSSISAVSLTTQRGTVVNLDQKAAPCARPLFGSTSGGRIKSRMSVVFGEPLLIFRVSAAL